MFGLTKREQRWKAEQQAAELLVGVAVAAINAKARIAEAEALAGNSAELAALRKEVAELRAAQGEKA